MRNSTALASLGLILSQALLPLVSLADVTVHESTQVTGGTLVQPIQQMARFSKASRDMLAPTVTSTYIRGNQKAVVMTGSTEIYDLDKETITRIDTTSHTYTVTTFAELRRQLAAMPEKMKQVQQQANQAGAQAPAAAAPQLPPNIKITYEVQSKSTGATRMISGVTAQEQVVTLLVKVTDTDPAASATPGTPAGPTTINYTLTTDLWVSPEPPPEEQQIRDFDMKMAKKIAAGMDMSGWAKAFQHTPAPRSGALLAGQPGGMQALEEMGQALAKIKGTHLEEITSFGGSADGMGSAAPSPSAQGSGGSVAGQVATDTATQTAAGESSRLGVFGNALSSSALNAFHRRKAQPAAAPAASGAASPNSAVLMEMTTKNEYSDAPAPESAFQVPAGYAQTHAQS